MRLLRGGDPFVCVDVDTVVLAQVLHQSRVDDGVVGQGDFEVFDVSSAGHQFNVAQQDRGEKVGAGAVDVTRPLSETDR